jgi:hypothetical protein
VTEITESDFGIEGARFSRIALLGRPLGTPPVVWKTTEGDGNPSLDAPALALLSIFQQLGRREEQRNARK